MELERYTEQTGDCWKLEVGKVGEGEQKARASSCHVSGGNVMHSMVAAVNNTVHLKVAKKDLTSSHYKENL